MRIATVLAFLLLMLHPAPAHAAWWWDYFDGLSGPGPFKTSSPTGVEFRVWSPEASSIALLADKPSIKWFAVTRFVKVDNDQEIQDQKENFKNAAGVAVPVRLFTLEGAIMRRFLINDRTPLDIGVGLSVMRFSGDTFDSQYRVGPILKFTLAPLSGFHPANPILEMLLRVPKVYGDLVVYEGFTGADFGNPKADLPTSEKSFRAGLLLDVTPLLCLIRQDRSACQ